MSERAPADIAQEAALAADRRRFTITEGPSDMLRMALTKLSMRGTRT